MKHKKLHINIILLLTFICSINLFSTLKKRLLLAMSLKIVFLVETLTENYHL